MPVNDKLQLTIPSVKTAPSTAGVIQLDIARTDLADPFYMNIYMHIVVSLPVTRPA